MRLLKIKRKKERKQCKEMRNKLKVKPKNFSVDNERTDSSILEKDLHIKRKRDKKISA